MTNKRRVHRLESVAYHEAGHVVMAHVVRRRFTRVTIIPEGTSDGHCSFTKPPENFNPDFDTSPRTRDLVERYAMTFFGGHIAQQLFTGRADWKGSEGDRRHAFLLLEDQCASTEEASAYSGWLWEKTKNTLKFPITWAMVEGLSQALVEHQKIGERRIRTILKESQERWLLEAMGNSGALIKEQNHE